MEAGCASGHLLCLGRLTNLEGVGGCPLLEPLSLGLGETGVIFLKGAGSHFGKRVCAGTGGALAV